MQYEHPSIRLEPEELRHRTSIAAWLAEVRRAKNDLGATRILDTGQEVWSHYSMGCGDGVVHLGPDPPGSSVYPDLYWIADTEPDVGKRESARTSLERIYASSPWASARLAAAEALGKDVDYELRALLPALATTAKNQNPSVRRNAVNDAGSIYRAYSAPEAKAILEQRISDNDHTVRVAAKRFIGYSEARILIFENSYTIFWVILGIAGFMKLLSHFGILPE